MSRAMIRSSQLLACVLVAAGLFGLYHEPLPASESLVAVHRLHYLTQIGLVAAGLLLFDPVRLKNGIAAILPLVNAWRGKAQ